MFEKFELPSWISLRDDDTILDSDVIEDIPTGKREVVGRSSFYSFLRGQRVAHARQLPEVYDVIRRA